MEILYEVVAYVNSAALQQNIFIASLRWFLIMVGMFYLTFIVYMMTTSPTWRELNIFVDATEFLAFRPPGMRRIGRRWRKISSRLDTGNEAEYKLAIIEADTILGEALAKMNLSGDTTDQRLAQVTTLMVPNLEDVLKAHQIRNNIVYDPDYRLPLAEARRFLEIYETAFRGLDLMG